MSLQLQIYLLLSTNIFTLVALSLVLLGSIRNTARINKLYGSLDRTCETLSDFNAKYPNACVVETQEWAADQ